MKYLADKFRRITSTGSYIPEIDGLRFFAVVWVFLYHLDDYLITAYHVRQCEVLQMILGNGHLGVELFFVISGFVLALPFAKYYLKNGKKINLRQYFLRRFTRLGPPYFLIMILLFFINSGTHFDVARKQAPHLLASLFYVHNIIYPNSLPSVNPVAWSLEVEIQFYILVPLFAHIFILNKNTRRRLLLSVMIIMPVIQYFYKVDVLSFYQFIQYFCTGFLLADLYISNDARYFYKHASRAKKVLLSILGTLIFFAILMVHSSRTSLPYTLFLPLAVLAFYFTVLFIPFWRRVFSIKWITILGGMSYSIYLIHVSVISVFGNFLSRYPTITDHFRYFIIPLLIFGSLTAILSTIFFYFIERPCMQKNWPSSLYKKIAGNKVILSK